MAAQVIDADHWIVRIKESLNAPCRGRRRSPITSIPSEFLVGVNGEAYIPQILSVGPHHHLKLGMSAMENYKLITARRTLFGNAESNIIEKFESMIKDMRELDSEIRDFYGLKDCRDDSLACMMVLDASFILHFFTMNPHESSTSDLGYSLMCRPLREHSDWLFHSVTMSSLKMHILQDIMKLENQIPLCVLEKVMKRKMEEDGSNSQTDENTMKEEFMQMLEQACVAFSPFKFEECSPRSFELDLERDGHFLGCLHEYVSEFLIISDEDQNSATLCFSRFTRWITAVIEMLFRVLKWILAHLVYVLPFLVMVIERKLRGGHIFRSFFPRVCSAVELRKVGVRFKPLSRNSDKIKFDGNTRTLYLPRIIVSNTTEVILRNLLALEAFNILDLEKTVSGYVDLMDTLIDTADDVALLRRSGIIHPHYVKFIDETIAHMWNSLCKPFSAGYFESPRELRQLMNQTINQNRQQSLLKDYWDEFKMTYLSRPWLIVSLLAGIAIVLMTAAQVFCLFYECDCVFHECNPGSYLYTI